MFGYVTADLTRLDEARQARYRACYCGLCRAIGRDCSQACRLSLTHDMTFLVLLLSSLYEGEERAGRNRCPAHPLAPQAWWEGPWSRYGAAMNVLLAYYNCLDDWQDDRKLLGLGLAGLFRRGSRWAAEAYPRQAAAVTEGLEALAALERSGVPDPDGAANRFGRLLGELFVPDPADRWAADLRICGEGLGRFVYILDAALDLPEDRRRGRYNPLSATDRTLAELEEELTMLLGECCEAFERLPLVQDVDLLRNILYAGVWQPYRRALEGPTPTTDGGSPHGTRPL